MHTTAGADDGKPKLLGYETFARRIASLLGVDIPDDSSRYLGLYDLGLDSLQAFELLVITEALAGPTVVLEEVPELCTMDDAYQYYASLVVSATTATER